MNNQINDADLIGQYIKLRDAVKEKEAIHELNGMSEMDLSLLTLASDSKTRTHDVLHKIVQRFEYLATGTGAYKEAMKAIEDTMSERMIANGGGENENYSVKTPQGTAYRQKWTQAKVADREEFMDFVFDGRQEGFLTNNVSKDAVAEYIEQTGAVPPGLDWTFGYKTLFRKAAL